MSAPNAHQTLYFGYGSNLWLEQMSHRCPSSRYLGVGRLSGYRWIINGMMTILTMVAPADCLLGRGYANVVPSQNPETNVFGLIYDLAPSDEDSLDRNEGVPHAYTKEIMSADFWSADGASAIDVAGKAVEKDMLVYIDHQRVDVNRPKDEYVHRMNNGISDALAKGIPLTYVDEVMRAFIPVEGRREAAEMARQQALQFEDEN